MASQDRVVEVHLVNDVPVVWDADSILLLRKTHRIVGSLIGSLPRQPYQNKLHSRPLLLSQEELCLLLHNGLARCYKINLKERVLSTDNVMEFKRKREHLHLEQVSQFVHERETKRRRFDSPAKPEVECLDSAATSTSEQKAPGDCLAEAPSDADAIPSISEEDLRYYAESTWLKSDTCCDPNLRNFADGEVHSKQLATFKLSPKYLVFKSLWEQGFYVTCGHKFGGDYLIYDHDPAVCHARGIVTIESACDGELNELNLRSFSRLATGVKKTIIVATIQDDNNVQYQMLSSFK